MPTYATRARDIDRRWFVVDAEGQILGRLASEVACLLRGKWNPLYVPNLDTGDHVVVLNASGIRVTGRKLEQKEYVRHTGYPGGLRRRLLKHRMKRDPEEVVREAIKGMLPKGPLGRAMLRKLKVYPGPEHPHQAQQPIPYALGGHGKTMPPRKSPNAEA
jgi:large subunit ribosomal protein L13